MSISIWFVFHGTTMVSNHEAAALVGLKHSGGLKSAHFTEVVLALAAVVEVLVVFEA